MRRYVSVVIAVLVCFVAVLASSNVYAQVGADRVAMTGLVTDPTGASVPGATVTLTNTDTGINTVVSTNSAGNFTTPVMILGHYTLKVEKNGFKTYTQPGLDLNIGGRTYTQDVTLQLGAVTQTVEVKASAQLINTQSPAISYQVGKEYYQDLPQVMGADVRLAETKLILSPGYVPTAPNGDAIFRGDAFESRINGGQTTSWESWFDGAEYGYAEGHQQTHESSIPYSAVAEMTTTVNNFSAQYGHTSGGLALYTTKSGTSQVHGSVYDFFTSSKLDANNYFLNSANIPILPLTQNNPGIAIGGPIPKIHKWGKTFWFTNYDRLDYHSTVNIGYVNTLPTPFERQGNFSQLLAAPNNGCGGTSPCQEMAPVSAGSNTMVPVVDALGRPIYYGEIYNPATTTTVGGVSVRNGYGFNTTTGLPCTGVGTGCSGLPNVIPTNDPLLVGNPAGQTVAGLIPPLDRQTLFTPNEFGGTSDDNDKINVWTWLLRVDHTFNDKWSASFTYFQNHRPRTAHCGGPQGCNTQANGQTSPSQNTGYIGQGFYQLITNHFAHLQLNWVIKPNLFNHSTFAYDRWVMNGHQLSSFVGWNSKLGLGLPNQPAFDNAGFPSLNFAGGPTNGYTSYGTPWYPDGADINNRYQFYDDLTWIVGKHTVKMGIQSEYINFPQTGWAVNTGGSFNFNALNTGATDGGTDANTGVPVSTTGDPFASFLLGQTYSANFTVFTPYMPKIYYVAPWIQDSFKITRHLTLDFGTRFDHNSGVSEQHNRFASFEPNAPNPGAGNIPGAMVFGKIANGNGDSGIVPRLGFAYQLGKNSVIRGGYGIYYGATIADSWVAYPIQGYTTNPTVNNTTNGQAPAYYFGNGFPSSAITFPPVVSPSVENGGQPVYVLQDGYAMPKWYNYTISFQHQWGSNMNIDIAYVGNQGNRLPSSFDTYAAQDNLNTQGVLSYGGTVLGETIVNGVVPSAAAAAGITSPYPGFTGTVPQALRPFPQYPAQFIIRRPHVGKSHYNSLQMQFNKRWRNDSFTVSYTYSRLINNGAESGQEGSQFVQNPSNMQDLYGPSTDDVPNILTIGEVFTLPFGAGQIYAGHATGLLGKLISHWTVSGILSYEQGRPQVMYANNTLGAYLFNPVEYPNIVSGNNPVLGGAPDKSNQLYYNSAAFSVPAALTFGNSPRTTSSIRGYPYYNEDVSIYKDTYFGENKYVRFESSAGNIFNRVDFCPPDSNIQDGGFGTTNSQCNIPRRIQFSLQIFF